MLRNRRRFEFCLEFVLDAGGDADASIPCRPLSHLRGGFAVERQEDRLPSGGGGDAPPMAKTTPLIVAVAHMDAKTVERMLRQGCDVNKADEKG